MTFEENFDVKCNSNEDQTLNYPKWTPFYYFGDNGGPISRSYTPLTMGLDFKFDNTARTFLSNGAVGILNAYPLGPAEAKKYGKKFAAPILTTQRSFAQAYGYFEIRHTPSRASGVRSSFWLLPVAKNSENAGRTPELDVIENYAADFTIGTRKITDRAMRPVTTMHVGPDKSATKYTNGDKLPAAIKPGQYVIHGFFWTPEVIQVWQDGVLVFDIVNPGVEDPHYLVLSMDILEEAGPVAYVLSSWMIDYVRAWALK